MTLLCPKDSVLDCMVQVLGMAAWEGRRPFWGRLGMETFGACKSNTRVWGTPSPTVGNVARLPLKPGV